MFCDIGEGGGGICTMNQNIVNSDYKQISLYLPRKLYDLNVLPRIIISMRR